jgi:hypothetical protein
MVRVRAGVLASVAAVVLGAGCHAPALPPGRATPVVTVEPAPRADGIASVFRLHVAGLDADPGALVLFRGALDSYHAARLRSAALPSTLDELRVPGTVWSASPLPDGGISAAELVLAPSERLDAGETYTFGALGFGVLSTFVVTAQAEDYADRVWPPHAALGGGKRWVFCGDGAMPPPGSRVTSEPVALTWSVGAGADSQGTASDRCIQLDADEEPSLGLGSQASSDGGVATLDVGGPSTSFVVPPPAITGLALDPAPISLGAPPEPPAAAPCDPTTVALGPACARVLDDRVFVGNAAASLFWVFSAPTTMMVAEAPGQEFMLGALTPGTPVEVTGTVTDLAGNETAFATRITTRAAMPHLVLDEVLANPDGVEKTSEWVELVNDGAADVDLDGWTLQDSGSVRTLPHAVIPAGAYVLVVPAGYDPTSVLDVPPVEGTLLVRVDELGTAGLSNQGETLTLRDPSGTVASVFPALAASKPGVSMARRKPTSADDDPTAFGASAPPGASPGAPNVLGY